MSNYTVHRGDSLWAIATRHHTTVARLKSANHLHSNTIYAGEHLSVPDTFTSSKKKTTTHKAASTSHVSGSSLGKRLASAARNAAMHMGGYSSRGLCATGVSRAIRAAMGLSVRGNGNQIDNNLPRKHFRQVHISLAQALKIPGCVLTWEHTSTRLGRIYGHTAITLGDGHSSASDFIERNTLAGAAHRTGLKIFIPY